LSTRRGSVLAGLGATAALGLIRPPSAFAQQESETGIILRNGKITTLDPKTPDATAIAIIDGKVAAVGLDADVTRLYGADVEKVFTSSIRAN
jgi:hypothetical protein